MKPYIQDKQAVLNYYKVNAETGLTDTQIKENEVKYGRNTLKPPERDSLYKRILHATSEKMFLVLLAAGIIALIVSIIQLATGQDADFLEVIGIFFAIILSVAITVVMEGKSQKAFEALNKLNEDTMIKIIRNGNPLLLPVKDIVVGDIIVVETGDKIAADGRLIESAGLRVDESALTGESAAVKKDAGLVLNNEKTPVAERYNMLYSGCFVTGGSGKMIVTSVGDATEFGKIAQELSKHEKSITPLQEKLGRLGKDIAFVGICAAVLVFLMQFINIIISRTANLETITDAFITSIILLVAAVPEGLPTIVAVSLSINIIKMSRHNALIKKMAASETIGCVNIICSDKTGTLTENKMTVTEVFCNGHLMPPVKLTDKFLLFNCCVNSTADITEDQKKRISFIGNPTECALLAAAKKINIDYVRMRNNAKIVHVYSFSSETKNMTTAVKTKEGYEIYSKGSPEKILSLCKLSNEEKTVINKQIRSLQEKAARIIAFAHKSINTLPDFENRESIENELIFDGFVSISDPLRAEVYASVQECKRAGIELKMLTGDNIVTATAIAKELNLLDGGISVEAGEIEHLSDHELKIMLPKIRVIARSTPVIKMRVVKALKALGNIVAVTGDGINDAPAIKSADVGIAMGISGTEVSKEASDIILLDDSFSTIATSVKWGRGIYENFQRFIQFQLTVNLSSAVVVVLSILFGFKSPFTALQLLWINLIMDGPPALTLGLEPIRGDLMSREPTKRNANILSKTMMQRILVNGIFISVIFMSQQGFNFMGATAGEMPTVLFALFTLFQLFNAFNARELGDVSIFKNFFKNKLMLITMLVTFILQILFTQYGGMFFDTAPLPFTMWIKIFIVTFSIILMSELTKIINRIIKKPSL